MTSEYVLSWLDADRDQGIDGQYFWIEEPYQTRRSCAEALLAKPDDGRSYYMNGRAVSRSAAQQTVDFYDAKGAERARQIHEMVALQARLLTEEAERNERRRQAQLAAVTGILQAHEHRPSDQKLEAGALAAFVIGVYEAAGKEV